MSFEDFEGTWDIKDNNGDTGLNGSMESLSIVEEEDGLKHIVPNGGPEWTLTCEYNKADETLVGTNCEGQAFTILRYVDSSEHETLQCFVAGDDVSASSNENPNEQCPVETFYGVSCNPDGGPDGGSWTAQGGGSGGGTGGSGRGAP